MIVTNNPMRGLSHAVEHKDEPKIEETVTVKEIETTHMSAESMTDLAKMVSSMLDASPTYVESHLHKMYHELDKRIAICEALIHNMK